MGRIKKTHCKNGHLNTFESRYKDGVCKLCIKGKPMIRYHRYKNAIYSILGEICTRCGFSDRRALQLDHVYGGGWRGTKVSKGITVNRGYGHNYLKTILDDPDIKEKYQILCANCNWIKRYENKEVPHKTDEQGTAVNGLSS